MGIDPYASISEGTLLATVRHDRAAAYVAALERAGITAAIVGEVLEPEKGAVLVSRAGERLLEHPGIDPFWEAFGRWAREPST